MWDSKTHFLLRYLPSFDADASAGSKREEPSYRLKYGCNSSYGFRRRIHCGFPYRATALRIAAVLPKFLLIFVLSFVSYFVLRFVPFLVLRFVPSTVCWFAPPFTTWQPRVKVDAFSPLTCVRSYMGNKPLPGDRRLFLPRKRKENRRTAMGSQCERESYRETHSRCS